MQVKNIFWRFVIPNNVGSLTLNNKSMNKPFFNKLFLSFSFAMLLTSLLSAQTPCANNPAKIICDDFETYNVGNLSPQAAHWIPWNLNDGSAVGAEVSTDFASNGTKAMKVKRDGSTGGDDQLLKLGNKSTGRYELKWKMYVPTGKAAYINVQTDENNPGASNANFAFQMYFRANGKYDMDIPTPTVSGDYAQGQWISLRFVFDLNNNIGKLFLNNTIARSWAYTQNLGAIIGVPMKRRLSKACAPGVVAVLQARFIAIVVVGKQVHRKSIRRRPFELAVASYPTIDFVYRSRPVCLRASKHGRHIRKRKRAADRGPHIVQGPSAKHEQRTRRVVSGESCGGEVDGLVADSASERDLNAGCLHLFRNPCVHC